MDRSSHDLLWKNISTLPYFRGFLRAVEGRYFQEIDLSEPILDLGNGDGHFTSATFSKPINIGIDPAFKDLINTKHKNSCEVLICSEGHALPFQNRYFSVVISNSVLEHIRDLNPVLKEVDRVLKKSGQFILTVPNDNFTKNLSIASFFERLGLEMCANKYRNTFNKISRHYHTDTAMQWKEKLENSGFMVIKSWNYFPERSLSILEWGHLLGIPSWISKKIFGKWILIPARWNLFLISNWLENHFLLNQKSLTGAYTFFITKKC
jgi:SAM-dependent methyltransferase